MPYVSILFGVLLIGVGGWGYAVSESQSPTALIPAAIGALLVLCGLLGLVERFLKHAMHAAAMVALLSLIATASMSLPKALTMASGGQVERPTAVISQALTAALCLVFVGLCINSFIQARKRRQARERQQGQPAT